MENKYRYRTLHQRCPNIAQSPGEYIFYFSGWLRPVACLWVPKVCSVLEVFSSGESGTTAAAKMKRDRANWLDLTENNEQGDSNAYLKEALGICLDLRKPSS